MLNQFKKLYELKNNNKLYEWTISLKHLNNGHIEIITSNGYVDGKKTIHSKIISEGKQKRTIIEQANQVANKKWNDKKKSGYVENIDVVEDSSFNKLKFKPMLANNFTKFKDKIIYPCIVQPKLDGFRCIAFLENNNVVLITRTGSLIKHFSSIKSQLYDILSKNNNIIFDGEIYSNDIPFNEIVSFIHLKDLNNETIEIEKKLNYFIFDCYDINNNLLNFDKRLQLLKSLSLNSKSNINLLQHNIVTQQEDIELYHKIYLKEKYEGIMVRNIDSAYTIGKRSNNLLKLKLFIENEYEIINAKEASGNDKGTVIWICKNENDLEFSVRPKGSRNTRKEMFDNKEKYIGKYLTVIYQELSPDKIPRFPVGKSIRENY